MNIQSGMSCVVHNALLLKLNVAGASNIHLEMGLLSENVEERATLTEKITPFDERILIYSRIVECFIRPRWFDKTN